MTRRILIADDDPHIRQVLVFALEKAGMAAVEAADGAEALERAQDVAPDLLVLDINMPRLDGLEVCRRLRAMQPTQATPILFLSSRDEEIDRIVGLEIGGDDYVTKPFSPREVVARVNAILKRTEPPDPAASFERRLVRGRLALDADAWAASWQGRAVALTATEFQLLLTLARHPGRVFTRNGLMDGAYGAGFSVSDRTIDSHIRHLRAKFAPAGADDVVETVHGVGYRLGRCGA